MQMTFSPEYNHFFVKMLDLDTNRDITLFRAVSNPDAVFEETFDLMSNVALALGKDQNIFTTCFQALPTDGMRMAVEKFLETAPSSDEVRAQAGQHITDLAELQKVVDDHEALLRELGEGLTLSEEEFRASLRILSIEMQGPGDGFRMGVCWGPRDFRLLMCMIPHEALNFSPEDLSQAQAQLMQAGLEGDECPYCAAGVPHPEEMEMPGEHAPVGDAPKHTLH
jgi:hypothetical protein